MTPRRLALCKTCGELIDIDFAAHSDIDRDTGDELWYCDEDCCPRCRADARKVGE